MAGGGKETPRQKMVGMMYLVLTALLALQVSNAVLDKFVFIDESLQHSVTATRAGNGHLVEGIKAAVEKAGNSERDKAVLAKAEKLRELTDGIIQKLYVYRTTLVDQTGGLVDGQKGQYAGAKDYDQVMNIMIGPEGTKSGKGYDMEKEMDAYRAAIMALDDSINDIPDLTPPAKDIDVFKDNPDQMNKDFVELNFDHSPLVASLAVLSQLQQEIAMVEQHTMEILAKRVGAGQLKFDRVVAVVSAESSVVAAGTPYRARMFIAASSSSASPRMTCTEGGVKVNENGEGEIEFTAKPGNYDADGKAKKEWRGTITIRGAQGDTTFSVTQEYIVARPVIQIAGAAVKSLYLRCGNQLAVGVPALGQQYDPTFQAAGGTAITAGLKKGEVILVPEAKQLKLSVYSNGNHIGDEIFTVKAIPKPDIEILNGGKPINEKQGGTMPRSLQAKAIPEASFAEQNPKDARYQVNNWNVTLARGRNPVQGSDFNGATANLNALAEKARPGDRLVISVKGVVRMNFQGKTEPVNIGGEVIKTYPVN